MQHAKSLNGSPSSDSDLMNRENLTTYLNDHLAGSVAALGLLDHLVETTKSTAHEEFFRTLRVEVAADQDVLRTLLEKFSAPESTLRKAGAWLMEKAARVKLRIDGSAGSAMDRLEALEALLLGIIGKRGLWLALAASVEPLENVDFARLVGRAEQQIETVETKRIEAAREAIGDGR
jgi:hypothetical protein